MKRNILLAFALMIGVLFFITGCGESGPSGPSDSDQINALLTKAATSIQSKNVSQLLECISDPFTFLGESKSHDQIAALLPTMPYTIYEFNNRVITVTGNTATVECINRTGASGVDPTNTSTTITLSKSSGQWVITSLVQAT